MRHTGLVYVTINVHNCTHISESGVAVCVWVVGLEDFYLSIHKHALCHTVAALKYHTAIYSTNH